MEISMNDIDALAVSLMRPVHVPDDISGKTDLLYPRNPLVDVGYHRPKEVTVGSDDLAQVGKEGVVDIVLPGRAVPGPVGVVGPSALHAGLDSWINGHGPPVRSDLGRQNRVCQHSHKVLDHVQFPIHPLPNVLPGGVDPARIEGVASKVIRRWHLDQ
jgi:hypothetical protein